MWKWEIEFVNGEGEEMKTQIETDTLSTDDAEGAFYMTYPDADECEVMSVTCLSEDADDDFFID